MKPTTCYVWARIWNWTKFALQFLGIVILALVLSLLTVWYPVESMVSVFMSTFLIGVTLIVCKYKPVEKSKYIPEPVTTPAVAGLREAAERLYLSCTQKGAFIFRTPDLGLVWLFVPSSPTTDCDWIYSWHRGQMDFVSYSPTGTARWYHKQYEITKEAFIEFYLTQAAS